MMKKVIVAFLCFSAGVASAFMDERERAQEKRAELAAVVERAQAGLKRRYDCDDMARRILSLKKSQDDVLVDLWLTNLFDVSNIAVSVTKRNEGGLELRREGSQVDVVLEQYTRGSDKILLEIHVAQVLSKDPKNSLVKLILEHGRDSIIGACAVMVFQLGEKIHELSEQFEAMKSELE